MFANGLGFALVDGDSPDLVHVSKIGARRHRHADPVARVAIRTERVGCGPAQEMTAHLVVPVEAASGEMNATRGAHAKRASIALGLDADDLTLTRFVLPHDQPPSRRFEQDLAAEIFETLPQAPDQFGAQQALAFRDRLDAPTALDGAFPFGMVVGVVPHDRRKRASGSASSLRRNSPSRGLRRRKPRRVRGRPGRCARWVR